MQTAMGLRTLCDNCPAVYNPDQLNSDGQRRPNGSQVPGEWASNPAQDRLGDVCDPDNDNDGLTDSQEFDSQCRFRLVADSDGDTVPDKFERPPARTPAMRVTSQVGRRPRHRWRRQLSDRQNEAATPPAPSPTIPSPVGAACTDPTDSDGDGCADWIEIVDVNGDLYLQHSGRGVGRQEGVQRHSVCVRRAHRF